MSVELILQKTHTSALLLPAKFTQVFAHLAKISTATSPRGVMVGQDMRLALGLSLDDPACAAFLLDFAGQGQRVRGSARGPSAALFTWAFHALAAHTKCTLAEAGGAPTIAADPEAIRKTAVAYLETYEADVERTRRSAVADGSSFLAWLAREEHIVCAEDADVAELGAAAPLDDATSLYEMLLESDTIDDVFVSERELASRLARFRARLTRGA